MTTELIVLIGGLGTNETTYKDIISALKQAGREVLFLNPDMGINPTPGEEEYFNRLGLPTTIQWKASEVYVKLMSHGIQEKIYVAGLSQGGPVALAFAGAHPEMVKRVVLINPSGMIGNDTYLGFLGRMVWQLIVEQTYAVKQIFSGNFKPARAMGRATLPFLGKIFLRHPVWRFRYEIRSLLSLDLVPVIQDAWGKGVNIRFLLARSDSVYPYEKVLKNIGGLGKISTFPEPEASHNAPYLQPTETIVGAIVS